MDGQHCPAGTVDAELRLWLSPLPMILDGSLPDCCPCSYDRTEACLSLRPPAGIGLHVFLLVVAVLAALAAVGYFSQAQSLLGIVLSLAAYIFFSALILWLLLGKIMNNYAVFFHRQRREVLFLRWNSALKRTDMFLFPWEKLGAWVPAAHPESFLTLAPYNPARPEIKFSQTFRRWRKKGLGLPLWRSICCFMELGPEHFPEAINHSEYKESRRPLPPELNAWRQALPPAHWAKASLESRWYNGFLAGLYPEKGFLELGVVEKNVPYPGPREAERQIKDGDYCPGFGGMPELRRRIKV